MTKRVIDLSISEPETKSLCEWEKGGGDQNAEGKKKQLSQIFWIRQETSSPGRSLHLWPTSLSGGHHPSQLHLVFVSERVLNIFSERKSRENRWGVGGGGGLDERIRLGHETLHQTLQVKAKAKQVGQVSTQAPHLKPRVQTKSLSAICFSQFGWAQRVNEVSGCGFESRCRWCTTGSRARTSRGTSTIQTTR